MRVSCIGNMMNKCFFLLLLGPFLNGCGELSNLERELGYADGRAAGYEIACGEEDMVPDHSNQQNEAYRAGYREGLEDGKNECETQTKR